LVFNLTSQFSTDKLFFFRSNLLAEFKGSEPVLQVHSHLKGKFRIARFEEAFLGNIMFEKNRGNMAHENVLFCFVLYRTDGVNHTYILAHLKS